MRGQLSVLFCKLVINSKIFLLLNPVHMPGLVFVIIILELRRGVIHIFDAVYSIKNEIEAHYNLENYQYQFHLP